MSDYKLSEATCRAIDEWVKKFPKGKQRSAVLMALRLAQDEFGYVTDDVIRVVAAYLEIPTVQVAEVATFYTMYRHQPTGRYRLAVCNSVSCMLCGSGALLDYLKKSLAIELGGVTKDGVFSLHETECIAACSHAPAMVINDEDFHYNLTHDKVDQLLNTLREQEVKDGH